MFVSCNYLAAGRPLDVTVAACDIKAGDVALSVPENLVVTLDRIFESEGLAEMLTAGKLSELACLTLYMMYEKKVSASLMDRNVHDLCKDKFYASPLTEGRRKVCG